MRRYKYIYPHINYNEKKPLHRFSLTINKKRYNLFSRHDLESVVRFRNIYLKKHYPERWDKVKQEEGIDETNNADNFHKHSSWVCGS